MKRLFLRSCSLILLMQVSNAFAYKEPTHQDISEAATEASVLRRDPKVLESLGLENFIKNQKFQIALRDPKTIVELIREGAELEDAGVRSLNHFFDPLHDLGLGGVNVKSPDWALEDKGDVDDQGYSLKDAYGRLYNALTLSDRDERMHYFGLVFENLGRAVHHIEDMAQPQHVRNDEHCDAPLCRIARRYNPSLYEEWTNTNREKPFFNEQLAPGLYPSVHFTTARKFWHTEQRNPAAGRGLAEFTNINFLSAGTNFQLDASGKPVLNTRYRLPEWNGTKDEIAFWDLLRNEEGIDCTATSDGSCGNECGPPRDSTAPTLPPACEINGKIVFYGSTVTDNYLDTPPVANPRASTLSIFDQDLEKNNLPLGFTLNRFNFQAAYPHLIPKAVAYSAGLIDYFFRGRLQIEDVSDHGSELIIEVRNVSGPNMALRNGAFELYYDAPNGIRRKLTLFQNASMTNLPHNALLVLNAEKPPLSGVDLNKDEPLTLVYRGQIGNEEGIASAAVEIPLSGFLVIPSYVPQDGIVGPRHVYREGAQWRLSPRIGLQAGDVDWKGWYVNGRPTKVITWAGPARRYSGIGGANYEGKFNIHIYANGRVLAVAPGPVLGAALNRATDGKIWIVAIVWENGADVVYRRPARRSSSPDLHHPVNAPDGWERLHEFFATSDHQVPHSPWLFNGNGNKAQAMRIVSKQVTDSYGRAAVDYGLDRFTYAEGIGIQNVGNLAGFTQSFSGSDDRKVLSEQTDNCGVTLPAELSVESRYTRRDSGEYVIAVDYVDDREIVAKTIVGLTATYSGVANYVYEYHPPGVNSRECGVRHLATSEAVDSYSLVGGQTVWVDDQPLTTIQSVDAEDERRCVTQHDPFSSSVLGKSHDTETYEDLNFIDLRHSVAGYRSMTIRATGICASGVDCTTSTQLSAQEEFSPRDWKAGALVLYTESNDDGAYSYPVFVDHDNGCPLRSNTGSYSRQYFGDTLVEPYYPRVGSWAIDSEGNVAVSKKTVTYLWGEPRDNFNLLTDGRLEDLIPSATAGDLFYGLQVLK